MIQAVPKLLTFDEFVACYGDNERYKLIDGELIDMEPSGPHEEVAAFVLRKAHTQKLISILYQGVFYVFSISRHEPLFGKSYILVRST